MGKRKAVIFKTPWFLDQPLMSISVWFCMHQLCRTSILHMCVHCRLCRSTRKSCEMETLWHSKITKTRFAVTFFFISKSIPNESYIHGFKGFNTWRLIKAHDSYFVYFNCSYSKKARLQWKRLRPPAVPNQMWSWSCKTACTRPWMRPSMVW